MSLARPVVHVVTRFHDEYEDSDWNIVCIDDCYDDAVRHALRRALEYVVRSYYDPRRRFRMGSGYASFRDQWKPRPNMDDFMIETWELGGGCVERTSVPLDAAIKDWISARAVSTEHVFDTLTAWSSGQRLEELYPYLDAVAADASKRDAWYESDYYVERPDQWLAKEAWDKRFGQSARVRADLATRFDPATRALTLEFRPRSGFQVPSKRTHNVEIAPAVRACVVGTGEEERVVRITAVLDEESARRLPEGVVRNHHSLHWQENREGARVFVGTRETSFVEAVTVSTRLPYVEMEVLRSIEFDLDWPDSARSGIALAQLTILPEHVFGFS